MKVIVIVVSAVAFSVSSLASSQYQQVARSVSHLAPRLTPHLAIYKAPTNASITRNDKCEKNFTHNELFALQKKFLDNFIAPNNAIQVRSSPFELSFSKFQPHSH